jgi:beta-phosphoglucomutase-like phosphatase (HAD superfamily)
MPNPRALSLEQATARLRDLSQEFAVIENHGVAFPPYDVVPLSPCHAHTDGPLRAVLMDMDGTTTLTEDLCIHGLTCALRDVTRRPDGSSAFNGLDHERDFPNIIGTSASTNVAYLMETYGHLLDPVSMQRNFLKSAAWNLNPHRDPIRRAEAETTVRICNGADVLDDPRFHQLLAQTDERALVDTPANETLVDALSSVFTFETSEQTGRAILDVYYIYLHGYFAAIARGEGHLVAADVYGDSTRPAIAPLRGVGLACALARGLLADCPNEVVALAEQQAGRAATDAERSALAQAAVNFGTAPTLVALVTSSGYYEARTILTEVFRGLRIEVAQWPVPSPVRERLVAAFASPEQFYDAIITADESHEIRLKPFRDLYTIAARALGLDHAALRNTVGFEDTWAGVTAMRCAGVGIPCAVPFEGSRSHDFSLAAHVFDGGISEAILAHALFAHPKVS